MPPERKETAALEVEVQWMAERLLQARIEADQQAFGSWLATA